MEDSINFDVSPRRTKKSRWGPVTENDSPIKNSDSGTKKVIPNGTGNNTSEALDEKVKPLFKEKRNTIKITKVLKSSRTEQKKEIIQSLPKEVPSPLKTHTSCTSPTSSHLADDGFHGFDNLDLSEKQSKKQDAFCRFLEKCNASANSTSSQSKIVEESGIEEIVGQKSDLKNNKCDEDMTVDTDHVSDSDSGQDSEQMEIDMGNDKDNISKADSADFSNIHDKVGDGTKDSDVDIMETDSVISGDGKFSKKNEQDGAGKSAKADGKILKSSILESTLKGGQQKVEYCGGCDGEVDDAEEGICCDGKCERWFHLRCSGLTQTEYNELSLDENAKWACNKCSGKPPPVLKPSDAKPLLSVRKDLAKVSTPSPAKRKSSNKEGSVRTPKIDISNPAFLKPFDFGWKRELVYRSTSDNHNRRQGDIYYYTPKGKKLRSLREITDHLAGSELTQDNFTFWKEPLGIEDPDKEIIRDAKLKLVNKDPSGSPNVVKKVVTPKITKVPKTTPKLTATVTPLDSSNIGSGTTPKASASVTPRVVLKGKTNLSTGPKFKITPSKNSTPGQTQKIVINKDKKKKGASDDELEMGMLPPMWEPLPKPKENKSAGVKRPLENLEELPAAKRAKNDKVSSPVTQNFLQNVNYTYKALLHAFQYLKVQELLRASRVCHMWRDLALHKNLWETVRMKNSQVKDWEGFSATLRRVGTRHLDLRKILVPDKQDAQLKIMWSDCVKALSKVNTLVKLDLCRCTSNLLEQIAAVCPQLESVAAGAIRTNQLNLTSLGGCHNLTELKLKSQSGLELSHVEVLENLTKLKQLSLTTVRNMKDVLEMVGKMTQLESLELGDLTSVTQAVVKESFSQLTKLRRLRLEKGQQECPTAAILQTISQLPSLVQLELINFDVKAGFDESLGLCSNIKILLIIPTYVTQSATTNHLVIEGVSKLSKTLNHFVWGLTLELLRVTDLFIDQWEMGQKSTGTKSPNQTQQKKSTGDSIPILKPSIKDTKKPKEGTVTQVDVLQLPKLHKVLTALLPTTKIIILKVPFSATWRQTISGSN